MDFSNLGYSIPLTQQTPYGYGQYPYQQQNYQYYNQPSPYNSYYGQNDFMNPPQNSATQYYGFDPYRADNYAYQQQQTPSYYGNLNPYYQYNNYGQNYYSDMQRQQFYQQIENPVVRLITQAEDDFLAGRENPVYYRPGSYQQQQQTYVNPYMVQQQYYNSVINSQKFLIRLRLQMNGEDYSDEAVDRKLYEMMYPQSSAIYQQIDPELRSYNDRVQRERMDVLNMERIMSTPCYDTRMDGISPIKKQMLDNYNAVIEHHDKMLGLTDENRDTYNMVDYFGNAAKLYREIIILKNRSQNRNLQGLYSSDNYQQILTNSINRDPYNKPMAYMKDNTVYIPHELAIKKDAYNAKRAQFINQILNVERSGVG